MPDSGEVEARILILDIETAPMRAYVWGRFNENISLDETISEWYMLCWSVKWVGDCHIYSSRLTPEEAVKGNDKRICRALSRFLDDADIVVAHNGKKFDIPRIKTRMIVNGIAPVSPYRQIDTCEIAKKQFGFSSNKLDNLARQLGMEVKLDTGFDLWKKCMEGDLESLKYMQKYNRHDVEILENVYLKLRPYIMGHPNMGVYYDSNESRCSYCGSEKLAFKGYAYTNTSKFAIYRCEDCGGYSRERISTFSKVKKKELLTSIPK